MKEGTEAELQVQEWGNCILSKMPNKILPASNLNIVTRHEVLLFS